jgi:methylenetetrahydrofolate dehydrogenase (NADP+)/methenyltetrahydrofolate cyclohydrolase
VERLVQIYGRPPGLAVMLVGDDPASQVYVQNKTRTAEELGLDHETLTPPANSSTEELLELIDQLNRREEVDGILVQLPLPPQIDTNRVLLAVDPEKDVDGLHPCNLGKLATGRPGPRPCTPAGIIEMLRRYKIAIAGQRAVVIGRSDLVGKPMALLLLQENATVTICHSKTADLPGVCREADILVAAIGRPAMVTRDFIKPGATVIDVGINRIEDREQIERIFRGDPARLARFDKSGRMLVGDVHPLDVEELAGAYTPVPGGVGALTIATLMMNTISAAERRLACQPPSV